MASDEAELQRLIAQAVERVKAMTPEQLTAMLAAQKESWVRGEMAMAEDERRRTGRTPAAPPPAPTRAELAGRLRDRAASMEDSDGMSSDTSKLLNEAATALGEPPDAT